MVETYGMKIGHGVRFEEADIPYYVAIHDGCLRCENLVEQVNEIFDGEAYRRAIPA